ncbi:glycerate kinase type-2 family protein [Thiohalorhabdus sp. Cl-TMA]|uniref:Glycerate kinase n=1 Tax=Thiohalorhabdus methylotrophus TaxID=3242694 RepID=A0ABV4TXK5_9GAMM
MERQERLKTDAEAAFRSALEAAEPDRLVAGWLRDHPGAVSPAGRTLVIAVGKGACSMVSGAMEVLPVRPEEVLVVTKDGHGAACPAGVTVLESGHPRPDARSLDAGAAILDRVEALGPRDGLLLLVSGGASALADVLPPGLDPEDWFRANAALVGAGLPIQAINAVRKHCSLLKGGQLARAAAPAEVTALLLSDVVGDDPAVIGSGPAAPDPTTYADGLAFLPEMPDFPPSLRMHLEAGRAGTHAETPKSGELGNSRNVVVGNNRSALEAAADALRRRGYEPLILTSRLQGEARQAARALASVALEAADSGTPLAAPAALLWGGETTVTLGADPGEGGRSQEMALAMAGDFDGIPGVGALCAGTDGTDGPTEAAGGWVDGATRERAAQAGRSIGEALDGHNSGAVLELLNDRLVTGPTGTNVMDLNILLVAQG